ncbi:hypothetical protein BDZ94DRAFT_1232681 [Collybia nuda]|uniref:Uncharacterized protein n=1 Tax=Collybia nuda TaxID=64659 RepID=A0A9P5YGI9_9AGAR|nr:hypothetical protein BDZ94DRAFT_1232681 [Collybia nuda]
MSPNNARHESSMHQTPASPTASASSFDVLRPSKRRRRNKEDDPSTLSGSLDSAKLQEIQQENVLPELTRRNHLSMRNIWLSHFTNILGSEEKALATLQPDADLPKFDVFKAFVCSLGRWGVGTNGWSYLSTTVNADCVLDMLDHRQAKTSTDLYRIPIHKTINSLYQKALKGNMKYTEKLPKMTCYMICHFCGLSVFKDDSASTHFERCYTDAVAKIFSKIKEQNFSPIPQPNPLAMAQHIVSHAQEDVPDMFTHLHNDHGYKLLACTDPFHYLCSQSKFRDVISEKRDLRTGGVSNTIFYASDIRRIRNLLGHDADEFGTICLADRCRNAEAKAESLAELDRMYEAQDPDRETPSRNRRDVC